MLSLGVRLVYPFDKRISAALDNQVLASIEFLSNLVTFRFSNGKLLNCADSAFIVSVESNAKSAAGLLPLDIICKLVDCRVMDCKVQPDVVTILFSNGSALRIDNDPHYESAHLYPDDIHF